MGNRVSHVSDSEAASDFSSLLERVRGGEEFVIEHDARPVAVLRPSEPRQSVAETFRGISATVPDADWERVPTDLAKNLDHYLYGNSKTTE